MLADKDCAASFLFLDGFDIATSVDDEGAGGVTVDFDPDPDTDTGTGAGAYVTLADGAEDEDDCDGGKGDDDAFGTDFCNADIRNSCLF